ncbi:MAG: DNA topoisomerase II [Candidatus Nanohaloarchaeota archaeon]|nr:DNA topoisomerase II [Candidatus Nanohaloarchaeota archaeon]
MRGKDIYLCESCGNEVEMLKDAGNVPLCCGSAMQRMEEKQKDSGQEKHLPFVEGEYVQIGEVIHPMEEKHYIEWVEFIGENGFSLKKFFNPGEVPRVKIPKDFKIIKIRAYCNLHGLWSLEV